MAEIDERLEKIESTLNSFRETLSKKHPSRSWWQQYGVGTVVAIAIAIMPPVTAGVWGWVTGWQKLKRETVVAEQQRQRDSEAANRDLKLRREDNRQALRERYLDKVVTPSLGDYERQLLFGYLVTVFKDDPLEKWASKNLKDAETNLTLKRNLQEEKVKVAQAEAKISERERKISESAAKIKYLEKKLKPGDLPGADEDSKQLKEKIKETRAELERERKEKKQAVADLALAKQQIEKLQPKVERVHDAPAQRIFRHIEAPSMEDELPIATGNLATKVSNERWDWTVFIQASENILANIQCVEYTLHRTFHDPVRKVCVRGSGMEAFALSTNGWGTFQIGVRVFFRDGRIKALTHNLTFY